MPVSKTEQFTTNEIKLAIIGRALSHPARIRICELINENGYVKNSELIKELKLSQTSVSNHIKKLHEADLINIDYQPNFFNVHLKQNGMKSISSFLESF